MVAGLLLTADRGAAQPDETWTLMEALSGATFERQVYDADGTLRKAQTLTFGRLRSQGEPGPGVVNLPVSIAEGDGAHRAQETTDVIWRCGGDALAMLMSVGTCVGPDRRLDVSLQTEGPPIRYPTQVTVGDTLSDLEFAVRGQGILGLGAARTRLAFVHRTVATAGDRSGAYKVVSLVLAKTSVFGLPVRRTRLRSEEWVDPRVGLIRHRLTSVAGQVWQMTRREPRPAGTPAAPGGTTDATTP